MAEGVELLKPFARAVTIMSLQEVLARRCDAIGYSGFAQASQNDKKSPGSPKVTSLGVTAPPLNGHGSGDPCEFEETVRKFGGRLLATARRYLRSEDDACDALQDAFLCAFRSASKFKGDSQLSTWLHRIVINSALMHLRAQKQRPDEGRVEFDELLAHFDYHGHWIDTPTCAAPAHLLLEAAETRWIIQRCIAELPDAYRIVLIMRDVDELDTGETARLLGLTANNVKVRLHRARQALKALIEREGIL